MMGIDELVGAIAALQRRDLEAWIAEALVQPRTEPGGAVFSEADCARVRLICTLHYDLDVESGSLPIVLSLLDQLHESRARLASLGRAVAAQDSAVREAVLAALSVRRAD
ncbi:MAG: hypothetical protein IT548_18385 [Alphaproteobacteria bacterium]|nr:hypothetical protein [Alphaproteobacteria bacterium]